MVRKATGNESKRSRLERARVTLREVFGKPVAEDVRAEPAPKEVLAQAWDLALDIESFARKCLPHYMKDPKTGATIDPAEFHKEGYQLILTEARVAVAAPREHAKSTTVGLIFVLYCICYKLRRFIVYISDTETQAIGQLRGVREELETNDKLRDEFGDLTNDKKWGEKDFLTSTGIQCSARGAGQSLRGLRQRERRPDLVICDDLENEEAVDSPERRDKLKRWFKAVVLNLGRDCQVIVIGTILHYDSLLAELLDEEKFTGFVKRMYVAVDDDWSEESVLWPQMWSLDALKAKLADIGTIFFDQEYRNRPINKDEQQFKEEWVERHAYTYDEIRDLKLFRVIGLDPAISKKQKADQFGKATINVGPDGTIYVGPVEGRRMNFAEQTKYVVNRFDVEQPDAMGVETVAYQKALKDRLDEIGQETGRYMTIHEVKADGDKFMRISTLSPLVENGTIRFLADGSHDAVLAQLYFLGKIKDDLADALEIAVRVARLYFGRQAAMAMSDGEEDFVRRNERGLMRQLAAQHAARETAGAEGLPEVGRSSRRTFR